MNVRRSWLMFFTMLVIAVCVVVLVAEQPILDCWNALHDEPAGVEWQCVGAGSGKTAAVAGWKNGELVIQYFTTDGEKLSDRYVTLPEECVDGTVTKLLTVREGLCYIGLYGPNAEKLYLYRIQTTWEPERLLAIDCTGDSNMDRMERTRLSELTYEDGVVSFALWTDDALSCYLVRDRSGLESAGVGTVADSSVLTVLSEQDGTVLQGGMGVFSVNGQSADALAKGQAVMQLTQGRGGWYYLDAVRMEVCFLDAALGSSLRVLTLDTGKESLNSIALTRDETAIMLLGGTSLTLTDAENIYELTGILHPDTFGLILNLVMYAGIALAAAFVLWLVLCGLRRGYAPIAVMRGSAFLACALLCLGAIRFAVLKPATEYSARREDAAVVSAVLRTANTESRWGDKTLPSKLARLLDGTDTGKNIRVTRANLSGETWKTMDGRNALSLLAFDPALADEAAENGTAQKLDNGTFWYVLSDGSHSLTVCMEVREAAENKLLYQLILGSFGVLALVALVILTVIGLHVRKISRRMERITHGSIPEKLRLHTGDELESMASIVNSLGDAIKKQEENRDRLERSYRRFIPEKILALFGKPSIQQIDKTAFAARSMAVMDIRFTFPESLYTDMNSSRLLFDSVNEVIARTSAIVGRKNGTISYISYNEIGLVMENSVEAVSTAVAIQQEFLSFNEARARDRLPGVRVRIALDKGSFMLGIVGDDSMMAPTTISSSLSTVQELIDLSDRLKAGILCTEAIISERQDSGCRYMGKCLVGGQPVRVYEVFDGDDFNTRRGKASSLDAFSKGVYDLYSGETAEAKHQFLQLAHNYPLDGGARYYLHLADRLEHDPSLPCVLNMDRAGGEI